MNTPDFAAEAAVLKRRAAGSRHSLREIIGANARLERLKPNPKTWRMGQGNECQGNVCCSPDTLSADDAVFLNGRQGAFFGERRNKMVWLENQRRPSSSVGPVARRHGLAARATQINFGFRIIFGLVLKPGRNRPRGFGLRQPSAAILRMADSATSARAAAVQGAGANVMERKNAATKSCAWRRLSRSAIISTSTPRQEI